MNDYRAASNHDRSSEGKRKSNFGNQHDKNSATAVADHKCLAAPPISRRTDSRKPINGTASSAELDSNGKKRKWPGPKSGSPAPSASKGDTPRSDSRNRNTAKRPMLKTGSVKSGYKESSSKKASTKENAQIKTVSNSVIGKVVWSDVPPIEYLSQVGQGTYGKVYKALDRGTSKLLAMKRLRLETQHEGFPVTAAREIKLLQVLRHPNIVKLSEIVVSKDEIYMALDYIEHDLAGLLLNPSLIITPGNSKSIIKQSLSALSYLHGQNVLHRDIKGSNILVTADGTVKLADFGLARFQDPINSSVRYTNRVITLWYRPPELLLGAEHYGSEVDTWGIGCLLVEVFQRTPLFHGKDEVSQIQAIQSIMGLPSPENWPEYAQLPWYHLIDSLTPTGAVPLNRFKKVFSGSNITSHCFDLASKLLAINPAHRFSAANALNHPYFAEEPKEERLLLHMEQEWHDWEAKKRKRDDNDSANN